MTLKKKLKIENVICDCGTSVKCLNCESNNIVQNIKLIKMKDITHPICPLNKYFEGDEDKCDVSKCDFKVEGRDARSCTETCKIKKRFCISVNVPRTICEYPEAYSKSTNCENCPLK